MFTSGKAAGSPTARSNSEAPHTIGTLMPTPTSKPMSRSESSLITPDAASSPKADPPLRMTALTAFTVFSLLRRSVSLVAGPPPLTSTPPTAPSSHMITVQPVPFSLFSALPSLNPSMSEMLMIFIPISGFLWFISCVYNNYVITLRSIF